QESDGSSDDGGQDNGQQESDGSSDAGEQGDGPRSSQKQSVKNFIDGVLSDVADGTHSLDLTDAVSEALSNCGGQTDGDQEEIPPYLHAVRPQYWHTDQ